MSASEDQFVPAPSAPGAPLRAVGYRTVLSGRASTAAFPRRSSPSSSPSTSRCVSPAPSKGAPPEPAALDVLVAGLHLEPARVRMGAVQTGVQAAVHPLAARALFGVPARELRGRSLLGEEVLGSGAALLRERLATAPDWPRRFQALAEEAAGWARANGAAAPRRELVAAWRLLEATRGRIRVEELAARVHLSRRRLSDLFAEELGLSPKQAARTMRFTHAVARIARGVRERTLDLAAVAAECGYADQSHLVREFRALAGTSPSGWIAEEFPNIQAGGHRYAAEWEA